MLISKVNIYDAWSNVTKLQHQTFQMVLSDDLDTRGGCGAPTGVRRIDVLP